MVLILEVELGKASSVVDSWSYKPLLLFTFRQSERAGVFLLYSDLGVRMVNVFFFLGLWLLNFFNCLIFWAPQSPALGLLLFA